MKEFECISIESRDELRAWLAANHTRTESIWLVTFKKYITDKHVLWAEVVEEALCFGWIDSRPRKLDADRTMLLSPRRPGSPWSRLNKQRVEKLLAAKLMMPSGLVAIEQAQKGRFVQTEPGFMVHHALALRWFAKLPFISFEYIFRQNLASEWTEQNNPYVSL